MRGGRKYDIDIKSGYDDNIIHLDLLVFPFHEYEYENEYEYLFHFWRNDDEYSISCGYSIRKTVILKYQYD